MIIIGGAFFVLLGFIMLLTAKSSRDAAEKDWVEHQSIFPNTFINSLFGISRAWWRQRKSIHVLTVRLTAIVIILIGLLLLYLSLKGPAAASP